MLMENYIVPLSIINRPLVPHLNYNIVKSLMNRL
jgi:uncharacterized ParB-like nuclease family protein